MWLKRDDEQPLSNFYESFKLSLQLKIKNNPHHKSSGRVANIGLLDEEFSHGH
jgi:hypothetical protein